VTAPCPCWHSPVTLHQGHCCMRTVDGTLPTCHAEAERQARERVAA
jgi:hypothetical protein